MARYPRGSFDPPETLHDLFGRHGIELHEPPIPGRQHGGSRSKIYCPQCLGGREHEKNFFVAIDRDGFGATWYCFRANNCGFSGGGRLKDAPDRPQQAPKYYRKPKPEPRPERPSKLVEYFQGFGIGPETLEAHGIYRTVRHMPVIDRDGHQVKDTTAPRPVIAYPYVDDGDLTNVKYKAIYQDGIKRFQQERGTKRTLFNIDSFEKFGPDDWGIFVEGEDDVLALWECGWRQVTTLPDGSPSKLKEKYDPFDDDDQRYACLYGEPRIEKLEVIILAGDMDPAGVRHHEEIARRVGKGRCRVVRWPEGCKDAKDTLKKRGVEAVNHALQTSEFYPLEGVRVVADEELANLQAGIMDRRILTGMPAIDERFCLNDRGQFVVITGISGRGKTTLLNALAYLYSMHNQGLMKEDRLLRAFHTVLCSAEMNVDVMMARLIAQSANQPFYPHPIVPHIPIEVALQDHAPWLRRHFTFVQWPDRATQPTLSWALERFRENILRTGAKLAILDPWQEFDDEMPDRERNHSRWIGKWLQRFIGLALETRCNVVIVAHPTKLSRDKEGKFVIPDGEEIADSRMFKSRCDIGLTVHRPNDQTEEMLVRCWKMRDARFARYGDTTVRYDPMTHRIWPRMVSVENDPVMHARRSWQQMDD